MSDLRVSVCCGAQVRPYDGGDPICCECGRENVMTETIAQRDHRMRVEGARLAFLSSAEDYVALSVALSTNPRKVDPAKCGREAERIVTEWEASNGSA